MGRKRAKRIYGRGCNRIRWGRILFILLVLVVVGIAACTNRAEYESGAARAQEGRDEESREAKEHTGKTLTKAEKPVQKNKASDIRQLLRNDPYQKELLQRYQKDERVYEIAKNRNAYPDKLIETLIQYPETMDFVLGYPERKEWKDKGIEITEEVVQGEIPLFIQWDKRWGYIPYGNSIVGISGCGPACLSMVLMGLTGDTKYDPAWMASYSEINGYWVDGVGTSWELMGKGAEELGLAVERLPLQWEMIRSRLDRGNPVICSMRPGDFTYKGHFIVLTGISKEGKITLCDPNSQVNSRKKWDPQQVVAQMKSAWSYQWSGWKKGY